MSLQSLAYCVNHDVGLRERVLAAIVKIARDPDPVATYGIPADTTLVNIVRQNSVHAEQAIDDILWNIALANEAAYQTAFDAAYDPVTNPDPQPGRSAATFSDAAVQSVVVANWPTS